MGKKRIHELAKELAMTSNELLQRMADMKILPGTKLGPSHSVEESVAEEIRRRLGAPTGGGSLVVRRRKKNDPAPAELKVETEVEAGADGPDEKPADDKAQAASQAELSAPAASEPSTATRAEKSPAPVVKIAPKTFEKATIVGVAKPVKPGAEKAQAPDFLKKSPQVSPAPTPGARRAEPDITLVGPDTAPKGEDPGSLVIDDSALAAGPAPSGSEESPVAAQDSDQGASLDSSAPASATVRAREARSKSQAKIVGQIQLPTKPVGKTEPGSEDHRPEGSRPEGEGRRDKRPEKGQPRKVTRELDPAQGGAQGKGRFEPARVVGVKPNWREGPRPDSPAARSRTVSVGGLPEGEETRRPRPSGPGGPGARPGGYAPRPTGGAPRPSGPPRPGAPAKPGVRVEATAPTTDHDRKKDRKKKGASHDRPGEDFAAKKRRELVERSDLYPEGMPERVRGRKNKQAKKSLAKTEITVPKAIKRRIKVDEAITVSELAHRLSLKAGDIIKKLMTMGVMASLNQSLDFDTATLVAAEFDYEVEKSAFDEGVFLPVQAQVDKFVTGSRSPVVTIMGHVDHGKTSLLDYIRKTKIQEGEAGGITQHIGAYHVKVGERYITFLDTPGHEAFTAMRSRGAQVTDIVILIVAADDGVMPQTREACDHAKAANVPIIVAVNKVDKPGANPSRIRQQMTELGLLAGDLGGETVFVDISAKTGQGVDELLDMILLQADILNLTARVEGPAKGRIIEARLDKGRGAMATLLVGDGVLRLGDPYVCGAFHGKIRALYNDQGQKVETAGPSIPVEIQGISGVPQAGDEFIVMEDEKQARQVSQHRQLKLRESELIQTSKLTLENLFDHIKAGAVKGLNLIIKADVQGSLEAILDAVGKLSTPEIKITVLHQSTGGVSETDVMLASASNALVICFGVRPTAQIQELAERERVQVRHYNVIYKLLEDIKEAMAGLLDPVKSEKILGQAEVRAIFMITKVGQVAGSFVSDGKIIRGARARLWRDGKPINEGRVSSLKREKADVREVLSGHECGICLDNFSDILVGDRIEVYQIEETAATVDLINAAVERAGQARKAAPEKATPDQVAS